MIAELYARECKTYGRHPADGELSAWRDVLDNFSNSDLDSALRRWHSNTMIEDFTGRPCGSRMPTAAELKLSIEQFERQQQSAVAGKFIPCGSCDGGWLRFTSGVTVKGNPLQPGDSAVKRCECFWLYLCARLNCSRESLRWKLAERRD